MVKNNGKCISVKITKNSKLLKIPWKWKMPKRQNYPNTLWDVKKMSKIEITQNIEIVKISKLQKDQRKVWKFQTVSASKNLTKILKNRNRKLRN